MIAAGCTFAVVTVIVLVLIWSRQPFRFLDGKVPVRVDDRSTSSERRVDRFYAFQADFDQLSQRAAEELAPHGFVLVADDRHFGPRAIQYERRAGGTSVGSRTAFVILYQNMHYKLPQYGEPYGVVGYDDPGWASVQVYVEDPPSEFDAMVLRVRGWLGL